MKTYKNKNNNYYKSIPTLLNNKKNLCSLLLLIFLISCSFNLTKAKFAENLYHTNEELIEEFDNLVSNCENKIMKKHELIDDANPSNKIPYYSIEATNFNPFSKKANTVFMLFGEHSRELIPTEAALFLAKSLCNKVEKYSKQTISKILEHTKVFILPVLNLKGRKAVAFGDYCKRTNENDVDLNRNWASHWSAKEKFEQTNPGTFPFSEWETAKLKEFLADLKPKTFITTHSGNLGMYSPFAYKKFSFDELTEESAKNMKNIQSVIMKINRQYCNCISGSIGNDLGYLCPGTCLDYAFENLAIANSFAFEIYSETHSAFYKNILEADNLEYFDYDKFVQKNSKSSLATLIQMKIKSSLKPIKLSVNYLFF